MLKKLLKHEFKATSRTFLLMYAVFLVVTLCNKLFLEFSVSNNRFWSSFQEWFMILYVVTCAAIFVMTAVLIVSRFYKNLMGDEGYLMFTLPVTVNQHIIAKAATSFIWMVISILLFLISVFILVCGHGLGDFFDSVSEVFEFLVEYCGSRIYLTLIILLATFFVNIIYCILQVYTAISIGQLVNKHRILVSVIVYFAINFAVQNIAGFAFLMSNSFDMEFLFLEDSTRVIDYFLNYMNTIGIISILFNLVISIGYFFFTSYILNKKLNLE